MSEKVKEIVCPVMQRKSFYANLENLLMCKIIDENCAVRELVWRRAKKAWQNYKINSVRTFKIPKLNYNALDYTDIILKHQEIITEPPLPRCLTNEDNDEFI